LTLEGAAGDGVELGGHGVYFGANHGAGFVDEFDGFVGQEAVGHVAIREDGGGDEGVVHDADAVVDLEALAQAAQNRDGVLDGGRLDEDGLEAALEGGVLLDVLAVLVEGGGADAVQLPAREHGLEHVAGVHCALGFAGADDGMQLVDEEDDAALGLLDFVEDGFEALFELAAELGAGDEAAHVEGEDGLVFDAFGDIAADDALGEALDNGGLADAGLADEDGVVLGLAEEDAQGAADLLVAADDRVELVAAGFVHEVAAVFGEGFVGAFGVGAGDALVAPDVGEGVQEPVAGDAEVG